MTQVTILPQSAIEQLDNRDRQICDCLNTFNQLRDFKLNAIEILEWKDSLNRIYPTMKPERLLFVIDKLMTGELDYKPQIGIQNLFKGLKSVEIIDGKYRIKEGDKIKVSWDGK